MLKAQLVQYAGDDEIHEIVNALRVVVKTGRGGNDDGSPLGKFGHVLEVNRGVGCLSGHDDEFATLLHGHDGRAGHEVVRDAGGQLSNRGSRAGADDDGIDFRRSRGGFGADVFGVFEDGVGRFRQSFGRGVAFVLQRQFPRVGDDQANGLAHLGEDFCETFAVDGSRCARDTDDDLAHGPKP